VYITPTPLPCRALSSDAWALVLAVGTIQDERRPGCVLADPSSLSNMVLSGLVVFYWTFSFCYFSWLLLEFPSQFYLAASGQGRAAESRGETSGLRGYQRILTWNSFVPNSSLHVDTSIFPIGRPPPFGFDTCGVNSRRLSAGLGSDPRWSSCRDDGAFDCGDLHPLSDLAGLTGV
jgi:hypothetical protein